jgi:putative flippase GtrA
MRSDKKMSRFFQLSFVKFLFVAGLNTLFGYAIYSIVYYLIKERYSSVVLSNIVAILFNFKTYSTIVFKSKDNSKIFKFFGVYLCTMCVNMVAFKLLYLSGITDPYVEGAIFLLPGALLSFSLMRKFVFVSKRPRQVIS